jgi:UDP-N-acetylglucosamine--N-acetylmuramyl-(pentapeptide) pyrophosphoryl-undecaprenol N-acetylglucosamine transferase
VPTIVFTGGGSAGHVTPNMPLIEYYQQQGWQVAYVGSKQGIEATLIQPFHIPYHAISCGKLRRQLDWRNMLMPFQVLLGIWQSWRLCRRLKPDVIFSKGGFVAVPLVVAAWLRRVPVIAHEADLTPGLANRLSFPFAKKICVTFEKTRLAFKSNKKVVMTGLPIRKQLLQGNRDTGLAFCGFTQNKPVLLCIGGSLGATQVNQVLHDALPTLLEQFQIVHVCGKGKRDDAVQCAGYQPFEYLNAELADIFACADYVISRAGANVITELLYLAKPHILIPLPIEVSRGDQVLNANYFAELGYSIVLPQGELTAARLIETIERLVRNVAQYRTSMLHAHRPDAVAQIAKVVEEYVH